jgi:hypothetical protein
MFLHHKELKEERDFYERQNKRLAVDNLLRELSHQKPKYLKQIKENQQRIGRLEWEIITLY